MRSYFEDDQDEYFSRPITLSNGLKLSQEAYQLRLNRVGGASEDIIRLYDEVARWTYKPGWQFWIFTTHNDPRASFINGGDVLLHIEAQLLDSRGSGKTLKIQGDQRVPWNFVEHIDDAAIEEFGRWFANQVEEMEYHESREWLRRDGEIYNDPHRKVGR